MTCSLCEAIATEPEEEGNIEAYSGSMTFEILATKDKKGHSHRFMVVAREHTNHVSAYEEATAKAHLFRFMLMRKNQLDRSDRPLEPMDFYILERTHASIKDHWHLISCSTDKGEDFDLVKDTDRLKVMYCKRGEDI